MVAPSVALRLVSPLKPLSCSESCKRYAIDRQKFSKVRRSPNRNSFGDSRVLASTQCCQPCIYMQSPSSKRMVASKLETRSTKTQEQLRMSQMQKTQVIVSHTSASQNHECLFFRQLLAKDVASKVHCDMYRRCHEGRHILTTTGISEQPHSSECRKARAPQLGVLQWPLWDAKIGFDDVQQVMRRRTWNTPYGASLESVAVSKDWQAVRMDSHNIPGTWFLKFDLQPEIISGILMLHTCHRLFFGKEPFARVVDDRQSANGKLVADIVKRDFQIMSRRIMRVSQQQFGPSSQDHRALGNCTCIEFGPTPRTSPLSVRDTQN